MGVAKTETGAAKVEKEKIEPIITLVAIMDENGNKISGEFSQYVNIKKDPKYVDGTVIKHIDLLGQKLKCKVKFNTPGSHKFKIKLVPDSNNILYTATEKTRNANFKYQELELDYTTESNGEKIIDGDDLFVSPAGGDIFTLSATDESNNTVVSAAKVKTERIMYYVEVKMAGLTTIASSLTRFEDEYVKQFITFNSLPDVSILHMENIGTNTDSTLFKSRVQTAYNGSQGPSKSPYCIAIAYTDHLAVKDSNKIITKSSTAVGVATPVNIAIQEGGTKYALWNNIITGEDWFVECFFVKDGGNPATDKVTITKDKITLIHPSGYPAGYFDSVNIDVSALTAETGTITLKVNWVNRMRAGLSFGGTNIVAICTKAWWKTINSNAQNDVMVHEIGHQLGMVTDGTGKLPDKTSKFYDSSKGHVGTHCHAGIPDGQARYDSSTDISSSTCVMYGATNGHADFCVDCAEAVKKTDLSEGV